MHSASLSTLRAALIGLPLLVIGCSTTKTLEPGMYIGSESVGWTRTRLYSDGDEWVYRPLKSDPSILAFVSVSSGGRKGLMGLGTPYLSLEDHVILIFNDTGQRSTIKVDGSDMDLEVGDSNDFTLVIPSHGKIPQFEARFRWSDKPVFAFRTTYL
jgi:hypothetical protein